MGRWQQPAAAEPRSRRFSNGTLVAPTQAATGFPNIPGVTYTGLKTTRYLFNYGDTYYDNGIPTINPPLVTAAVRRQPRERSDLPELRAHRPTATATTSPASGCPT